MRRSVVQLGLPILLSTWLFAEPVSAQSQSPLVYESPVFEWKDNRDPEAPRASPNAFVGHQIGSTRVMIAYGSPGVKGRKVFGGLVPYGAVWRTGANEATTITFSDDVLIEGHDVPEGTYSLFTIPGEAEWTIILNDENNQWGAYNYQQAEDMLRFTVAPQQAEKREWLTFSFQEIDPNGFSASVALHWDTTRVAFTVKEP